MSGLLVVTALRSEYTALRGRASRGRITPAAACASGGDCAACAPGMVAGMSSKVFFEHAVGSRSGSSTPTAAIQRIGATVRRFAGTG